MNDDFRNFSLTCKHDDATRPVLVGVDARGRIDGVLFELTLRQTYRNTSAEALEVVYTFPLPHQAVLLGFASELNGQRLDATVMAKPQAEQRYEEALESGDAPVMLEAIEGGLHTANIGNLKPGDEMVLEVRFAQLLAFEQGRLRLSIPTTIAPRYGQPAAAGLQAQQVPLVSMAAEYPLALSLTLGGTLAQADIACPTHRFDRTRLDAGVRLDLAPGAWLDRDVVIVVTPRAGVSSLVIGSRDGVSTQAPQVMMAAMQLPAAAALGSIAVKLLVDCSGSMGGDSIASARAALRGACQAMGARDHVSLTRFGSSTEHLIGATACTPANQARLNGLIDTIDADMGGTEMEAALQRVFDLRLPTEVHQADVLLLTDGEIWQADETIAAARKSGHRLFVIGVGSSPAEGVLRGLAEATGGACEFATPGEALEAAAQRMLVRIRQARWRAVRIDWGSEAVWHTALPANVFGWDMLIAFAGLAAPVPGATVRLLALDAQGREHVLAQAEREAAAEGSSLARIAAARRLADVEPPEALALALAHQLMSAQTNCVMVHWRTAAEKVQGLAQLQRVDSMLAAGWGGNGSVMAPGAQKELAGSHEFRKSRQSPTQSVADGSRKAGLPRKPVPVPVPSPANATLLPSAIAAGVAGSPVLTELHTVLDAMLAHLAAGGSVETLPALAAGYVLPPQVVDALAKTTALGASAGQAWLLLANWAHACGAGGASLGIEATLRTHVAALPVAWIEACAHVFAPLPSTLSFALPGAAPTRSRRGRLRAAVGEAGS